MFAQKTNNHNASHFVVALEEQIANFPSKSRWYDDSEEEFFWEFVAREVDDARKPEKKNKKRCPLVVNGIPWFPSDKVVAEKVIAGWTPPKIERTAPIPIGRVSSCSLCPNEMFTACPSCAIWLCEECSFASSLNHVGRHGNSERFYEKQRVLKGLRGGGGYDDFLFECERNIDRRETCEMLPFGKLPKRVFSRVLHLSRRQPTRPTTFIVPTKNSFFALEVEKDANVRYDEPHRPELTESLKIERVVDIIDPLPPLPNSVLAPAMTRIGGYGSDLMFAATGTTQFEAIVDGRMEYYDVAPIQNYRRTKKNLRRWRRTIDEFSAGGPPYDLFGGDDDEAVSSYHCDGWSMDCRPRRYPYCSRNSVLNKLRNRRKRRGQQLRRMTRNTILDEAITEKKLFDLDIQIMREYDLTQKKYTPRCVNVVNGRRCRRYQDHNMVDACQMCSVCCARDGCPRPGPSPRRYVNRPSRKMIREFLKEFECKGPAQGFMDGKMNINDFSITHALSLKPLIEELGNLLPTMKEKTANWKSVVGAFALLVVGVWSSWGNWTAIFAHVAQFLNALQLAEDLMKKALTMITGFFRRDERGSCLYTDGQVTLGDFRGRGQSGDVLPDWIRFMGPIGGTIAVLCSLAFMKQIPSGREWTDFITRFSKLAGCIRSVEEVAKCGSMMAGQLFDYIAQMLGYPPINTDGWVDIRAWCDEVSGLKRVGLESDLKNNVKLLETIDSLILRGDRILRQLDNMKIPINQRSEVQNCVMFLNHLRDAAAGCGAGHTRARPTPLIVQFVGVSGVGKSSVINALNAELLVSMGTTDPNDFHQKVFYKAPSKDERWDGFTNETKIVVCDDIFAKKDSETNPSPEPYEVIRMGNTAYWQLAMAHLSEKGSTFFSAPVVIWTTNRFHYEFESLTNQEAVWRRVNLRFRCAPKKEFAKVNRQDDKDVVTLDQTKCAAALAAGTHKVTDFLEYIPLAHQKLEEACGEPMSFVEMANHVCAANIANLDRFKIFKQNIEDYMNEAIERCKDGYKPIGTAQMFSFLKSLIPDRQYLPSFNENLKDESFPRLQYSREDLDEDMDAIGSFFGLRKHPSYFESVPYLGSSTVHVNWRNLLKRHDRPVMKQCRPMNLSGFDNSYADADCCVMKKSEVSTFADGLAYALTFDKPGTLKFRMMFRHFTGYDWMAMGCPEHSLEEDQRKLLDVDIFLSRVEIKRTASWTDKLKRWMDCYDEQGHLDMVKFTIVSAILAILVPMGTFMVLDLVLIPFEWLITQIRILIWGKPKRKKKTGKPEATDEPALFNYYDRITEAQKTGCLLVDEGEAERYTTHEKSRPTGQVERYSTNERSRTTGKVERYQHTEKSRVTGKVEDMEVVGEAQMVLDQNAAEIVKIIHRNLYRVEILCAPTGEWTPLVNGLMIKGRILLLNRHVLAHKDSRFRIVRGGFNYEFNMERYHYVNDDDPVFGMRDAMLVELPRQVHQHVDIISKFMTSDDFSRFRSVGQMCMIGYAPGSNELTHNWTRDVDAKDKVFQMTDDNDHTLGHIRQFFCYGIQTKNGECGSALVAFDASQNRKIMGIHAAGWHNPLYSGVGQPVSQGYLKRLLEGLECKEPSSLLSPTPPIEASSGKVVMEATAFRFEENVEGNFVNIGVAKMCHASKESKIRPSPVHAIIAPPTTKPAFLSKVVVDGEMKDPMSMARKKADVWVPEADEKLIASASNHLKQLINKQVDESDRRVLTLEEAITGIEGDEFKPAINRRTSPGYGWEKRGKGKTHYLGEDAYIVDHPEVLKKHAEYLDVIRGGGRPSPLWVDTLKDERRPIAKVNAGKTRLFSVGCFVFNLLFRQYFLGFTAHMMRRRIDVESCVGINVYSQEWTALASRIQEVGKAVLAGDFGNFDGTLNAQMLWEVLNIIEDFYGGTEFDRMVRRALWSEIVNSIHIVGSDVYMWTHSNPSGCPITAILNSVYHSLSARYVFLWCALKYAPQYATLDFYDRFVRHNNYGDDDLWNVAEEILGWFNQTTITEAYKTIGMDYTDEGKTGVVVESRVLGEVAFLKRDFRWDSVQARYRSPLSLDTIREMPMWVRSPVDVYQLTSDTLCEAVHELSQHSKQVFQDELPKFERARKIIAEKVECAFLTYEDYQSKEFARQSDEPSVISACTTAVVGGETHDEHDEVTRTELVAFHEEGDVVVSTERPSDPIGDYLAVGSDSLVNDIVGFLKRPVVMRTFKWTDSDVPLQSVLATRITLPMQWIAISMILQKLQGFIFLKCDIVVRTQVNAQPFNAGRLMSVFEPYATQQRYRPSNFKTFSGITGYRHVDLDLSIGTASEFRIPFMMPFSHYDLIRQNGLMGDFDLLVYSALTGSANVGGTVWVHAENIDVQMPTGLPLPSFGDTERYKGRVQMARLGTDKTGTRAEAKSHTGGGKIERIARASSALCSELGDVPVVGEIAKAGEWVSDAIGGVASVFGFSKPVDGDVPLTVSNTYARNMANYDGDCKAKPMGLASTNSAIMPNGMYGTEEDEMSLSHILQKPVFLDRFSFASSDVLDKVLWMWEVQPANCRTQTLDDGFYKENTYLSYLSESFNFWRGTIVYDFKIVKTNYHSGRIRLIFVPGADKKTDLSKIDVDKCYTQIVDIRNNTEFSFGVPYVYNLPWKFIDNEVSGTPPTPVPIEPTGTLYVLVLNELVSGGSAADHIEFLVEERAGKDFQFGVLNDYDHFRIVERDLGTYKGRAQMDFFPTKKMEGFNPNQLGLGEAIVSLRQCLKRYAPSPVIIPISDTGKVSVVSPYLMSIQGVGQDLFETLFNKWGHMYRMMSGNMRMMLTKEHAVPGTTFGDCVKVGLLFPFQNVGVELPPIRTVDEVKLGFGGPRQNFFPTLENAGEFEIPFYQPFPTMPTPLGKMKYFVPGQFGENQVPFNNGTAVIVQTPIPLEFYTQIGEDFSFGYLVGPPVTYLPK